jgi:signal transduction histidine kinase
MKIKTKLTLGVGFLLILIIILAVAGIKQINSLASATENILVANYNSLDYSRNMLKALDVMQTNESQIELFQKNLIKQQNNITEIGEADLTNKLSVNFKEFIKNKNDSLLLNKVRSDLYHIMKLNMDAIDRKSLIAKKTAENATVWLSIIGALCFLFAFILLVNLPGNIANPIKELTESIKQIASKKYSERVHFESNSEFGELAQSFNTMAKKLEEYNNSNLATLMKEKKRIEMLINNMHDPVIGFDENLSILFANEEAIKIMGCKVDEIIGQQATLISQKNDLLKNLIGDLKRIESKPEISATSIKIFANHKEGYFEKETLPISIIPTGEKVAQLIGHVVILRNVTQYKELDFAKTNFIATISHEFKTPISAIKMSLQLLQNDKIGPLNIEQKNLIDSINDDATRLLKFTAELLNMTQVESGNIQLSIMPCDPKEILLYAINATQTQATQKQINFNLDCPINIPKVQADNEKTAWVLTNLISNAIRYSHELATIFLTVKAMENNVLISVTDTGQGIAPQYQDKIFERYFRVPGSKKDGTGLGLSISKEFIEAQNGQIKLESELGKGSTFTVILNAVA